MTRNDSVSAWWRTLLAALVVSKVLAAAAAQSDCTSVPGSQIPRSASTFQAYPHSDDATDCPALCDKWATTCKQVAAAWSKCAGQHYAARFKMADAVCATSPTDVQRDVCEAHVDADRETYGRAETDRRGAGPLRGIGRGVLDQVPAHSVLVISGATV